MSVINCPECNAFVTTVEKSSLEIIKKNREILDQLRPRKGVSHVFRLNCPVCMTQHTLSNSEESDGTITLDNCGYLQFNCRHCGLIAELPSKLIGTF